jgi:hypothetical protein
MSRVRSSSRARPVEEEEEEVIVIDEDLEMTRTPLIERVRRRMMQNPSRPEVSDLQLSPTHPVHAGVAGRRRHQHRIQEAIQRYRMQESQSGEVEAEVEVDEVANEYDIDDREGWEIPSDGGMEFVSEDEDEDEILF